LGYNFFIKGSKIATNQVVHNDGATKTSTSTSQKFKDIVSSSTVNKSELINIDSKNHIFEIASSGEKIRVVFNNGKNYDNGFYIVSGGGQVSGGPSSSKSTVIKSEPKTNDSDEDGLSDQKETELGTNLNKKDTDGDGFDDKSEIDKGYNPCGEGKLPEIPQLKVLCMRYN